ncbi:MAG: tRNA methyltransferase [Calditrichia bacterium]|nr:tRNA methyltransferase [Calditrichia bacterium]
MITEARKEKIENVLKCRQPDLTVVFENIFDPHNVSAILRSCDAVGILETYLLYTNTTYPKLGKKSSASAKKWIKQNRYDDYAELKTALKEKGFKIYATHVDASAKTIYEVDWAEPSALIMGNEHFGVSEEALEISDERIYIPQTGMIQSLNVSVATAVILYEAYRQRNEKGFYDSVRLEKEQYDALYNEWAVNKKYSIKKEKKEQNEA